MNSIYLKAEWHSFDLLQKGQSHASISYVQTYSTAFSEHKHFLLHEASTHIFQDMTKDLEVPFVPSKTHEI